MASIRYNKPGHYSLASLVDLKVPCNYSLRIEPHPQFFNDDSGTFPAAVIGNIQTNSWPMFLFITFKAPTSGTVHLFKKGMAIAQVIVVPHEPEFRLEQMTDTEAINRETQAQKILKKRKLDPRNQWISKDGLQFDDMYRRLHRSSKKIKPKEK